MKYLIRPADKLPIIYRIRVLLGTDRARRRNLHPQRAPSSARAKAMCVSPWQRRRDDPGAYRGHLIVVSPNPTVLPYIPYFSLSSARASLAS